MLSPALLHSSITRSFGVSKMTENSTCRIYPERIKRVSETKGTVGEERGTGLEIIWTNGEQTFLESNLLRRSCPCADCREKQQSSNKRKRSALAVIEAGEEQETDLRQLWTIGNYALGIRWGDGHDAGIYTFSVLRELADSIKAE